MTFRERDQLCFRLVLGISRENNDNNAIMRDWCGNGSKIRGRPGLLYFGGGEVKPSESHYWEIISKKFFSFLQIKLIITTTTYWKLIVYQILFRLYGNYL